MNRNDPGNPLRGLRVPTPPEALRSRVLGPAAEAMQSIEVPTVWDRLWAHRGLRVAWCVATLGLVAAHFAVSLRPAGSRPENSATRAATEHTRQLRDALALPHAGISPRAEALVKGTETTEPIRENEVKS